MDEVYISYSRKDSAFVDRLSNDLRNAGYMVWVDRQQLSGGASWVDAIESAINRAEIFLIVVSNSSMESKWTREEISLALSRKKRIIPLLTGNIVNIPASLRVIQSIDFVRKDYEAAFSELLRALPESIRTSQPLKSIKPKAKGYFFISYAKEDAKFIERMREFLRKREYGYWDYQESERDYDTQISLELEQRIEQAAAVLCILSPDWKSSRWAPKEYLFALDVKVPTFLLMIRDMGPTLVTEGVPYIDFVQDITKGFAKLDQELRRKDLI